MSDLRELAGALQAVVGHVGAVSWTALAFALCFQLAKLATTARGWQGILRASYPDATISFPGTFGAYLTAVGLNAVLPARTGEVARLALVKRRVAGSTYPALAATILVESLIDAVLLTPVLAAAVSLGLLAGRVGPLAALTWVLDHPWLVAASCVGVVVIGTVLLRLGLRRKEWLRSLLVEARRGFSVFRGRPGPLARVTGWQALALVCRAGAVWWFLKAFHLPTTPRVVFAVLAVQAVAGLVPLLPGGAGAQQAMLLVALAGLVPASALLGFSVGTQATVAAFDVALCLIAVALMLRTVNVRRSLRLLRTEGSAPAAAVASPVAAPARTDG